MDELSGIALSGQICRRECTRKCEWIYSGARRITHIDRSASIRSGHCTTRPQAALPWKPFRVFLAERSPSKRQPLEPLDLEPETVNGQPEYRYTLPNGTIVPGELKATLAGWPDTGPLTAVTRVPRPIRITTEFPRGALLRFSGLRVTWTGGEDDPDSQVRIAVHMGGRTSGDYLSVRASSGGVVVPPSLTRNATIDEIRIYQEGRLPQWMDVPGFNQFANEYLYEWRYILR